jgi:hypothetical protein
MEQIGLNYISVAEKWLHKEKYYVVNPISSAILRGVWLTSNDSLITRSGQM